MTRNTRRGANVSDGFVRRRCSEIGSKNNRLRFIEKHLETSGEFEDRVKERYSLNHIFSRNSSHNAAAYTIIIYIYISFFVERAQMSGQSNNVIFIIVKSRLGLIFYSYLGNSTGERKELYLNSKFTDNDSLTQVSSLESVEEILKIRFTINFIPLQHYLAYVETCVKVCAYIFLLWQSYAFPRRFENPY